MEAKENQAIVHRLISPFQQFIKAQTSGGIVLFVCAVLAMTLANLSFTSEAYFHFWHQELSIGFAGHTLSHSLHHWVNDGLMAIFFFVIGLELKREIIGGELSSPKKAILPIVAGLGGMLVPALLYVALNHGKPGANGWGIPMATDIAFALGIMALLGKKVPLTLKIFLTALAIADDIGAVLVIAFFYTSQIDFFNIALGATFLTVLVGMNYIGVRSTLVYGLIGIGGVWLSFLLSGVHATIAGVLAALTIPARTRFNEQAFIDKMKDKLGKFMTIIPNKNKLITPQQLQVLGSMQQLVAASETPLQRLEYSLHKWVLFFVMPVFALANAGIQFGGGEESFIESSVSMGVFLGLLLGKVIGVYGAVMLLYRFGKVPLPDGCKPLHILGVSFLAGVGFTMSLFVTELAFTVPELAYQAKLGILLASLIAGLSGYFILKKAGASQE
jgi:NhaA family Na+:H+ antiporter